MEAFQEESKVAIPELRQPLRIAKTEPTARAVLDKIIKEFKDSEDCQLDCRQEEMQ